MALDSPHQNTTAEIERRWTHPVRASRGSRAIARNCLELMELAEYKKYSEREFIKHSIGLTLPGLARLLGQFGSVSAQQSSLALEEVIVTATKREQNLQDVSVAVTALSEEMLREVQIVSAEDLTQLVPSLNLQKGSNVRQTSFNIRGIGTQSFSTAVEPSVSTMGDGVVMGRSGQAFMRLLDIERVEVLRGPQGTLFGKNSTGGVVHLITQDPTEEFSGELMGSVLSGDEYRAGATISGESRCIYR